jgi:cell wall-associated NlpC family hydrolase
VPAIAVALLGVLALAGSAFAQSPAPTPGGAVFTPPPPPAEKAQIVNGRAIPPISAPPRVVTAIEAANQIVGKPYRYGGGHRLFSARLDSGYDCSGSVSHALRGGNFLKTPLDSSSFLKWGQKGPGAWITVYTAPSHAYVVIAGLRFDTSMREPNAPGSGTGPAWSTKLRVSNSFVARHPRGY